MKLEVKKEDIHRIGNMMYSENGNLAVMCSAKTSNIEEILLRNILKCFGKQYKITASYDFWWSEDITNVDIVFETNLPYSIFQSLPIKSC